MTYDKIECVKEPGGFRVRLHSGAAKWDDFLYDLCHVDGHQPGTVQERVARTFGVAVSRVELVTEFSKE